MLVKVDFGNVARKVKDIATKLGLIDDYIVAHGTSGIWTWRKWSSGVAECWGEYTTGNVTKSAEGSLTYTSHSGTYPSGLFKSRPVLNGSPEFNWLGGINLSATINSATKWKFYLWSSHSGAPHNGVVIGLRAIGKWK